MRRKNVSAHGAVFSNLMDYLSLLNRQKNPKTLKPSFLHIEQKGIAAIDSTGHGDNVAALRLYVYADEAEKKLHLITLRPKKGKKQQNSDVEYSKDYLIALKKAKGEN